MCIFFSGVCSLNLCEIRWLCHSNIYIYMYVYIYIYMYMDPAVGNTWCQRIWICLRPTPIMFPTSTLIKRFS